MKSTYTVLKVTWHRSKKAGARVSSTKSLFNTSNELLVTAYVVTKTGNAHFITAKCYFKDTGTQDRSVHSTWNVWDYRIRRVL